MVAKPASFELRIDELVLDGVRDVDPAALHAAIEQELGRLLAEHGPPSRPAAIADGGTFEVPTSGGATAVGAEIARAAVRGADR